MTVLKPKINVQRLAPRPKPRAPSTTVSSQDTLKDTIVNRCREVIKEVTPPDPANVVPAPPSGPRTSAPPPRRSVNTENKVKAMDYINGKAYHIIREQKMNIETSHVVMIAKPAKSKDGTPHVEDIVILSDQDVTELAAWLKEKKGISTSVAPLWEDAGDDQHW